MVIIITGGAEPVREKLGRLLAQCLEWEFVDGDLLRSTVQIAEPRVLPDGTASSAQFEGVAAALQYWNYQWRDVVVTCSMLTEQEQKQLNKCASVKFVHLVKGAGDALIVDSSQAAEQIVADVVSVLILNRRQAEITFECSYPWSNLNRFAV